jgi:hypothetical protein
MTLFLTIEGFPRAEDRYETTRDLHTFTHTHDELRRYRDYLMVTVGPRSAYRHIMYAIFRSLKLYFREHFEWPYLDLFDKVESLANRGLMAASSVALSEDLGRTERTRQREHELLQEITGGVGNMSQGFFPDHWDALDRLRRLYAMRASLVAQETIPAVPRVAEILSREFGGDIALPRFIDAELTEEQQLAVRTILATCSSEDVFSRLQEFLPPTPPGWDSRPVMAEICQAVIRTFLEQMEDDAFMVAWVETIRPILDQFGNPDDKAMSNIEAFLADTERSSRRRFPETLQPDVLDWIAGAEACGHPIDPRALRMAAYPPDAASDTGSPAG